jgi:hypothetical protein
MKKAYTITDVGGESLYFTTGERVELQQVCVPKDGRHTWWHVYAGVDSSGHCYIRRACRVRCPMYSAHGVPVPNTCEWLESTVDDALASRVASWLMTNRSAPEPR